MDNLDVEQLVHIVDEVIGLGDVQAAALRTAFIERFGPKTPTTDSTAVATDHPAAAQAGTLLANTYQVGGEHYQASYQHWDWMADVFGPAYFVGAITRYVTRWQKKNGIEDLRKALHYHAKLVELIRHGFLPKFIPIDYDVKVVRALDKFFEHHPNLGEHEKVIFGLACTYEDMADLDNMYRHLDALLYQAKVHSVQYSVD